METKICLTCNEDKPLTEFHTNGWNGGKRNAKRKYHAHCKQCTLILDSARYISRLTEAVGGKLECSHCGYDDHFNAIEFHHTDPSEKEIAVSKLRCCSYKRLKEEVDKCIMLCANCHRLVHAGIIK